MPEGRVLAIIDDIYDAAAGGTPWTHVGHSLTRLVGAKTGWLVVGKPVVGGSEHLYAADFPRDAITAYQTHYREVDLWTNRVAAVVARSGPGAPPKTRISGQLVPDKEYIGSEFYADFGRRLGLRHVIGTVVPLGAAGVMPIGLHRPDTAPAFDVREAQLLDCLLPHLRRAMQLRNQLKPGPSDAPPGLAALDALATAVMVVDADLRILIANAAAECLAVAGGSIRMLPSKGDQHSTLAAVCHADNAALGSLVRATAAGGSGGGMRLRDASLSQAVALLVSPLPRRLSGSHGETGRVAGQALIVLRELSSAPPPDKRVLRELFDLTQAEAQVACALAGGASKGAVASARGLQESTVRTQVKSILAKTGTSNLRDFERLLASVQHLSRC